MRTTKEEIIDEMYQDYTWVEREFEDAFQDLVYNTLRKLTREQLVELLESDDKSILWTMVHSRRRG